VRPDKLLWDSVFRDLSELVEEGAALEVEVKAVAEADFLLTLESVGFCAEWESDGATALLEAGKHLLADLLGEAQCKETILNLLLLSCDVFERVLIFVHFHYYNHSIYTDFYYNLNN